MKHALFMLCYTTPLAIGLVLFDVADSAFAVPPLALLGIAGFMAFMALSGFHFFDIRGRHLSKKTSEIAIRGVAAGLALIALSIAALFLGGFRVGFYFSLALSVILAPLALIVPYQSRTHHEEEKA